ncbi:MAG: hypothetical protein K2O89_07315 [Clostridia bacterium]|nr:hypothetical protein [Clostridia bacterium]
MINQILNQFQDLFNGKIKPFKFSIDMPKFICDNYDEIENENAEIAQIFNDYVPEICDEGEPGFDPTHMIAELKKVYDKAKAIYDKAE